MCEMAYPMAFPFALLIGRKAHVHRPAAVVTTRVEVEISRPSSPLPPVDLCADACWLTNWILARKASARLSIGAFVWFGRYSH